MLKNVTVVERGAHLRPIFKLKKLSLEFPLFSTEYQLMNKIQSEANLNNKAQRLPNKKN